MDDHNHIHIHMLLTFMCWLLLTTLPQSHCESPAFDYSVCKKQSYNCGELSGISYPFWGQNRAPECGGGDPFELNCHDDGDTTIQIGSQSFRVKDFNINAQTMRLVRTDLALNVCSLQFDKTYVNSTLFQYSPLVYNITIFYDCWHIQYFPYYPHEQDFMCGNVVGYFRVVGLQDKWTNESSELQSCKRRLQLQTNYYDSSIVRDLTEILNEGFEVNYNVSQVCTGCLGSQGDCWVDGIIDMERVDNCYYCPDGSHGLHCSTPKTNINGGVAFVDLTLRKATAVDCIFFQVLLCTCLTVSHN